MKLYHTETQEDYNALMIELEDKGAKWLSGEKPTSRDSWSTYTEDTCVRLNKDFVSYAGINYFEEVYPDIPIQKYKARTDDKSGGEVYILKQDIGEALRGNHDNMNYNAFKEDLKKAQWYLQGVIDKLEGN